MVKAHYSLWAKCTQLWPLNNLMYIILHWKCCFCIEKDESFRGLRPPGPPPGALPLVPTEVLKWDIHATRLAVFCTFRKMLLNQWGTQPFLPTGTLKQSYATVLTVVYSLSVWFFFCQDRYLTFCLKCIFRLILTYQHVLSHMAWGTVLIKPQSWSHLMYSYIH